MPRSCRQARVPGGPGVNVRFEPVGSAARAPRAAGRQVDLASRRADRARWPPSRFAIRNYLDAADTQLDAAAPFEQLGAIVEQRAEELVIRGCGLRNAQSPGRADRRRQRRHADATAARVAGVPARGRASRSTATTSIRRRPVDRIAEPLRAMGARIEAREDRFPPFTVHGAPLAGNRVRAAGGERPGQVVRAAGRARHRRDDGDRAGPEPRSHRADAAARRRPGQPRGDLPDAGLPHDRRATPTSSSSSSVDVPGDLSSAAFLIAAGVLVPGSRLVLEGVGVNWTRAGFLRILERMGAIVLGELEPAGRVRAARAGRGPRRPERADRGDDRRGRRGAAGDRRAAAGRAARLLRRGGDDRARGGRAAGQGVGPDRNRGRRTAGPRRRDRGGARRVRGARHRRASRRPDRRAGRPPAGAARARSPGSPPRRASRWSGWRPRPCPIPASPRTRGAGLRDGRRDRWPGGRREIDASPGPSRDRLGFTYLDSGAMYRARRAGGAASAASSRARSRSR